MRRRHSTRKENVLLVSVGGFTLLLAFLLQTPQPSTSTSEEEPHTNQQGKTPSLKTARSQPHNHHIITRQSSSKAPTIASKGPGGSNGEIEVQSLFWKGQQRDVVAGEVLLALHSGADEKEAWAVANSLDANPLGWIPTLNALRLEVPSGESLTGFAFRSQRHPQVKEASPNQILRATGCDTDINTHEEPQWPLNRMGSDALCLVGDDTLLNTVRVAVMDSGVAYGAVSDALGTYAQAPGLSNVTFDIVNGSDLVNLDDVPADDHYHGTHITSIIANDATFVGVSPNTTILPLKILDRNGIGSESTLAEGMLLAAAAGVDVVNMSVAFDPGYRPSWLVQEATRTLTNSGALLVASSGNAGSEQVQFPGAFPDVIAVGASRITRDGPCDMAGALNYQDTRAGYSSYGYGLDVLAPGGSVFHNRNCDGIVDAVFAETIQVSPRDPNKFGIVGVTGTSQAAAHVTGAIAWMIANTSGLTPAQIRQKVLATSKTIDGATHEVDVYQGSGLIQGSALLTNNALASLPEVYVNIIPMMVDGATEGITAKARVEVMTRNSGGQLSPVVGARVLGQMIGADNGPVSAQSDQHGVAWFESAELMPQEADVEISASVTFEVLGIVEQSAPKTTLRPMGFYQLGEGMGAGLEQLLEDVTQEEGVLPTSEALVLIEMDPTDTSLVSITGGVAPKAAYVYKTLGAGNMTAPMASIMTPAFLAELQVEDDLDELTLHFDTPQSFGWGGSSTLEGKFYQGTLGNLPSTNYTVVLPMDSHFSISEGSGAVIINSHADDWSTENQGFNSGEDAEAIATGYSATLFGTGYSATLFGTITQDTFYATSENLELVGAGGDENLEDSASPELGSCTVETCEAVDDD